MFFHKSVLLLLPLKCRAAATASSHWGTVNSFS